MSLTDTLGSLAVATKGQYMTGVSVDIGTSFVKPGGKVGDILKATATITGIGASPMSHITTKCTLTQVTRHHPFRQIARVHACRLLQRQRSAGGLWTYVPIPQNFHSSLLVPHLPSIFLVTRCAHYHLPRLPVLDLSFETSLTRPLFCFWLTCRSYEVHRKVYWA